MYKNIGRINILAGERGKGNFGIKAEKQINQVFRQKLSRKYDSLITNEKAEKSFS